MVDELENTVGFTIDFGDDRVVMFHTPIHLTVPEYQLVKNTLEEWLDIMQAAITKPPTVEAPLPEGLMEIDWKQTEIDLFRDFADKSVLKRVNEEMQRQAKNATESSS